jgi:hypothetical protein
LGKDNEDTHAVREANQASHEIFNGPDSNSRQTRYNEFRSYTGGGLTPTPSTVVWSDTGSPDGTVNINIQPAQKPKKLQELSYQSLRTFQSEFLLYHVEAKGQATLHGHITDKMVTVIDSLLGANRKYAHLLGHGRGVSVPDLPEYTRREYPWLHTTSKEAWTDVLEALKVLRPEGGSFTLRSFEHLLVMAEECQLNFSFETKTSGEDTTSINS